MTQRKATTRPFLPQDRPGWLAALRALAIVIAIGFAVAWVRSHAESSWFTWLALTMLIVEPFVEQRYSGRRRNSAHQLHHGRMAIVTRSCSPIGRVNLDGTSWAAKALDDQPIEPGECVYVHDGEGQLLHVSRQEPRLQDERG